MHNTNPESLFFHVGIMESLNGFKLSNHEPDDKGFFPVVVGCFGIPTRGKVIYDPQSLIECMRDTSSRFNICLRDGNLCGEYGHPVIESEQDLNRLFRIDEHYKSHYFGDIWTGEPITINGMEAIPIRAKVKPCGPYGDALEKELRDPYHNTSFSIRSLCLPMQGPKSEYEYRKVQMVITFDAVHAPGFDITSKRYVSGTESFETPIKVESLNQVATADKGMESSILISAHDVNRLTHRTSVYVNGTKVGDSFSNNSILGVDGTYRNPASLIYKRS